MIDIAAIVTVHKESVLAGPTLRSANVAVELAERAGFSVEKILGFDNPPEAVEEHFDRAIFSDWEKFTFDFSDQGELRNKLVTLTEAQCVAFLDADDLWAENWLVEGMRSLNEAVNLNKRPIVHPELNWFFEGHESVRLHIPQASPLFAPEYFYIGNYYDALCIAPREAYLDCQFGGRDISRGFAYEDWSWNIETMANGWEHVVARDTIIFKRRRGSSQSLEAHDSKSIFRNHHSTNIENIRNLGKLG